MITVNVRSFITPLRRAEGFELGRTFEVQMPINSTLRDLVNEVLAGHFQTIGLMAVNGEVALEERQLSSGDKIDIYPLLEGG